jgi:hypothetical protein
LDHPLHFLFRENNHVDYQQEEEEEEEDINLEDKSDFEKQQIWVNHHSLSH